MIIQPGIAKANLGVCRDVTLEDHVSLYLLQKDAEVCEETLVMFFSGLQPLNPNPDSQWNAYFKDNEVLLQIDKDVR